MDKRLDILAVKLRELRGCKTLNQVADRVGITAAVLSCYERGERVPRMEIFLLLADYYHVSPNYLLGLE